MQTGEHIHRSGSEVRQRSFVIGFRATASERAELEEAARRVGVSLSSYIRSAVLRAPQNHGRVERELLAALLAQLGRVGGNVYQISRALNFKEPAMADIPAVLADVKAAGAAILHALGRDRHDH